MKPAAALAVCLIALSSGAAASGAPSSGVEERRGAVLPLGERFVTSRGTPTTLGGVLGRGRPALLVLAYNRCAMLCSLVLRGAADLTRELARSSPDDFDLVSISIDPRDTPDEARRTRAALLERAGLAGSARRWEFLVGTRPAIDRVADRLGFRYTWDARSEQYAHPAVLFVISGRGQVLDYFYGLEFDARAVRAALERDAPAPPRGVLESVLSCFRFEATARRYGDVVRRSFQIGAAAVFAALLVGVVQLLRRERRAS